MDDAALAGLSAPSDSQAQQRALQYFEQLKVSTDGWQICANALTSGLYSGHDHVKFFCFQVIEHYLKNRYAQAANNEHQSMKAFLMSWLQLQQSTCVEKNFLRNKAAQILSLAFVCDYPHRWPQFLTDIMQMVSLGEPAVDMYLKLLMAIDAEVVDREVIHSAVAIERNTLIKDTLRVQCVPQMVDSWYHILTTYESLNSELTCQCLEVIGAYVSWIDISLIANDKFVGLLLRYMNMPLLRESACDCIYEITNKGMDPVAKTKLIESFTTVLESAGVLDVSEDDESDYLAKLAKLVNGFGLQLIQCWQNCETLEASCVIDFSPTDLTMEVCGASRMGKTKDGSSDVTLEALESKVLLMLRFLGADDDDVSGTVTQFAHDYVTLLKQLPLLNDRQKQNVKNILCVVVEKMKYDESYSFVVEGEDEAMFQEYRKELKIIFNNLGALDSNLILTTVQGIYIHTLENWQNSSFRDVEIAITLLYMLAEALPAAQGQHFNGDASKVSVLKEMMAQLISTKVSFFQHPSVALQFFETVVRYDKFFNMESQFVPEVLMAFLDGRGLRNVSPHVRSRSAYLFSRFVKAVNKQHLHNYLEEILTRCQDLLVLHPPNNGLVGQQLSADDQLFMYETAGTLVAQSNLPSEKKQELMRQLLAPIVGKFEGLLQQMVTESDPAIQERYAECLSQAMGCASRTSKGFSTQLTVKSSGCIIVYTESLEVFLLALDVPVHRQLLQTGVRQFLHRMVVCLDHHVLPYIPRAMEKLMKNADARELHDFIPLINQVVMKFKKQIIPFLEQVFMPVVSTIFHVLASPSDERDQVAATEKRMLQRGYFSFLATLVNNNVTEVLSNQDHQALHQVLCTLIQGATDLPDPLSQKPCFTILTKLVLAWGGLEGLNGFGDFIYESVVPACFMAPMKSTFDLADAQTILVLNESAVCMKAILEKRGDEFISFLQARFLPTLNLSSDIIQEYCQALKSDLKVFRSYIKAFFLRAKS